MFQKWVEPVNSILLAQLQDRLITLIPIIMVTGETWVGDYKREQERKDQKSERERVRKREKERHHHYVNLVNNETKLTKKESFIVVVGWINIQIKYNYREKRTSNLTFITGKRKENGYNKIIIAITPICLYTKRTLHKRDTSMRCYIVLND